MRIKTIGNIDDFPGLLVIKSINNKAKRFVITFLMFFILLTVIVALFNYVVNPFLLYAKTPFIPHFGNMRVSKMKYLETREEKPEAYIIGSSNCGQFDPEIIERYTGWAGYNLAVYWGRVIEQWVFLNYLIKDLGARPKLIVCGYDLFSFRQLPRATNEWNIDPVYGVTDRRLTFQEDFMKYTEFDFPARRTWARMLNLVSWQQTMHSFRRVRKYGQYPERYAPWSGYLHGENETFDFATGMQGEYGFESREQILSRGREYGDSFYNPVSTREMARVVELLELCEQNEITCIMIAMPINPSVREFLLEQQMPYLEQEQLMKKTLIELSAHYERAYYYDPALMPSEAGLTMEHYDAIHISRAYAAGILEIIMGELGDGGNAF